MNASVWRILIVLTTALGLYAADANAEPNTKESKKPDAEAGVKGSKSNSSFVDKIREIGNDVSQGIHRATQGVRDVGDKAGKKTKDQEKGK
jgi:hypothetical protein